MDEITEAEVRARARRRALGGADETDAPGGKRIKADCGEDCIIERGLLPVADPLLVELS